jgi:hypothetical protein
MYIMMEELNHLLPLFQQFTTNSFKTTLIIIERTSQLGSAAKGTCFYKTSIHNQNEIKKPFVFVEGISFEKIGANINTYTMAELL